MKIQIIGAYVLVAVLMLWSIIAWNSEFLFYALTTLIIVALLQYIDKKFNLSSLLLWGFNIWIVMHILWGLLVVWDTVLYSQMILPIIWEPYNVLKYDQIVHFYCYFIITLIIWSILVKYHIDKRSYTILAFISVLAAMWVGWLNEIIEFLATVFIADVNVGGYENTAIDIIANTLWALTASMLFKNIK